jgi:hypothetical protein
MNILHEIYAKLETLDTVSSKLDMLPVISDSLLSLENKVQYKTLLALFKRLDTGMCEWLLCLFTSFAIDGEYSTQPLESKISYLIQRFFH